MTQDLSYDKEGASWRSRAKNIHGMDSFVCSTLGHPVAKPDCMYPTKHTVDIVKDAVTLHVHRTKKHDSPDNV